MTAWQEPPGTSGGSLSGIPVFHLVFLMAMGATAALLTLAGGQNTPGGSAEHPHRDARQQSDADGFGELMAQMSHELRTPLNAVIGFSEVMLRELHGPLGHSRYQEYAHHISKSGGRLLKSSEDALAVTETMSVLMTSQPHARREKLMAGTLVREAWRSAAGSAPMAPLQVNTCNACDVLGDKRTSVQALEHLLREANARAITGGAIEVRGRRRGASRTLEIRVASAGGGAGETCLRVILARLLLRSQGASITCTSDDGSWSAVCEFAGNA
jgi:signal transduction histidine kinase